MLILSEFWNTWATKESIYNSARTVGISKNGLNVEWMQHDKFATAEALIDMGPSSTKSIQIDSPKDLRKG